MRRVRVPATAGLLAAAALVTPVADAEPPTPGEIQAMLGAIPDEPDAAPSASPDAPAADPAPDDVPMAGEAPDPTDTDDPNDNAAPPVSATPAATPTAEAPAGVATPVQTATAEPTAAAGPALPPTVATEAPAAVTPAARRPRLPPAARRPYPAHRSLHGRVHVVRAGECLSVIADGYGLSWPRLAELNNVAGPDYVIYPGQLLALG